MSDPWSCEAMSLGVHSDQSDRSFLYRRITRAVTRSPIVSSSRPCLPSALPSTIHQCPFVIVNLRPVRLFIISTPFRQPPVASRICKRRSRYNRALSLGSLLDVKPPDTFFPSFSFRIVVNLPLVRPITLFVSFPLRSHDKSEE
jgi:hypothetical protein